METVQDGIVEDGGTTDATIRISTVFITEETIQEPTMTGSNGMTGMANGIR